MSSSISPLATSISKDVAKPPDPFKGMWILFYRHGMNSTLQKNFTLDAPLLKAVERAKEHCKVMNYKYIFIRPLICNLDEEEAYHLNKTYPST